jgi:glycopeptide antibiotics resistance protein
LAELWYIPYFIKPWVDIKKLNTIRTGIPLLFLGMIIPLFLKDHITIPRYFLISWMSLTILVIIAEAGQLLLPLRTFDILDIFWGGLGAYAGLVTGRFILTSIKKPSI